MVSLKCSFVSCFYPLFCAMYCIFSVLEDHMKYFPSVASQPNENKQLECFGKGESTFQN